MDKAWMLRQDGKSFPCIQHLYVMHDDDLSSESEVASFLLATQSKDEGIAMTVLEAWMALLIEDQVAYDADAASIRNTVVNALHTLPYKFPYNIPESDMLNIWDELSNSLPIENIDDLYAFIDERVRPSIDTLSTDIENSLNQQFCRVRYGGQYNTLANNNEIWFRVSSVGYNWANNIYLFVADKRKSLQLEYITICRDYESDYGDVEDKPEFFYKAKDGTVYYHMPIEEYYQEEHEHSPVFSTSNLNRGILASIRGWLADGKTIWEVTEQLEGLGPVRPIKNYFMRSEWNNCIDSATFLDDAFTRTRTKLNKVTDLIKRRFPEITKVEYDFNDRENTRGNNVGFELICTLSSDVKELDGLSISIRFTKSFDKITSDILFRQFRLEYTDYLRFSNITI